MKTHDISYAATDLAGFTRTVRVSEKLLSDSMFCPNAMLLRWDISSVDRLKWLLQDVANQLAKFPSGTQAARLRHFRIPPSGSQEEPLGLEIGVVVVEDDKEHGDYLLVALHDEFHTLLLAA